MNLPETECRAASGLVAVTADFTAGPWLKAEAMALRDYSGGPAEFTTIVRTLGDRRALHIGFDCRHLRLIARMTQRDQPLWQEGNVVEVFIDPAGRGETYYEFQVNPLNTLLDIFFEYPGQPWREGAKWNARGIESAVKIHRERQGRPTGWSAHLAIPWENFGTARPSEGDAWRINFYRYNLLAGDGPESIEYSAWSPTVELNFHQPNRFGFMRFMGSH